MRLILLLGLSLALLTGCKKEQGGRVDIYMLESFRSRVDLTTTPATLVIEEAVLQNAPLVADRDIRYYKPSNATFRLKKDIKPVIERYGPDRAFAVTVDGQPVYYGRFQPAYMSSVVYGLATIEPMQMENNELKLHYVKWEGSPNLEQLDKRNDIRIIRALMASGRIR
jgi:hypothetical protein